MIVYHFLCCINTFHSSTIESSASIYYGCALHASPYACANNIKWSVHNSLSLVMSPFNYFMANMHVQIRIEILFITALFMHKPHVRKMLAYSSPADRHHNNIFSLLTANKTIRVKILVFYKFLKVSKAIETYKYMHIHTFIYKCRYMLIHI